MSKLRRRIADQLPSDWRLATLRDVASLGSGTTPSRSRHDDFFNDGTVPWVKTGDLTNGRVRNVEECVTERAVKECGLKVYPEGTVLLAMYGGFRQIGRTGILAMRAAINQAITAINPDPGVVISPFLLYWLNSRVLDWRRLAGSSRKDPNISKADIASFPIPIAPVKEQREIADLLQTWDVGIEETTALIRAKHELRRGLAQQLLTGQRRFPGFIQSRSKQSTRLGTIPDDWELRHLDELADINARSLSERAPADYRFRYISLSSIEDGLVRVPKEQISFQDAPSRARRVVRQGDILVATVRPNLKGFALADFPCEDVVCSTGFAVITPLRKTDKHLIFELVWSDLVGRQMNKQIAGSSYPAVTEHDVRKLLVPLPTDPRERATIGAVFASLRCEIELLTAKLHALKEQKKGLMQKLLTGEIRVKEAEACRA